MGGAIPLKAWALAKGHFANPSGIASGVNSDLLAEALAEKPSGDKPGLLGEFLHRPRG